MKAARMRDKEKRQRGLCLLSTEMRSKRQKLRFSAAFDVEHSQSGNVRVRHQPRFALI